MSKTLGFEAFEFIHEPLDLLRLEAQAPGDRLAAAGDAESARDVSALDDAAQKIVKAVKG